MSDPGRLCDLERVQQELWQRLRGQVRELRVVANGDHVLLEGIAATYYAKQLAQHFLLGVLGDTLLVNRIDVQRLSAPDCGDESDRD
jgi:hypothetical protein